MKTMYDRLAEARDELQRRRVSCSTPCSIEVLAEVVGIDVSAPYSYREVAEMAEESLGSPYIGRVWVNGERLFYPTTFIPELR